MRLKRVQGLGELFGMLVGGAGSGRDGVAEGRQSKGFSRCASSFAMMRCHFEKRGKEIELLPLLASILLANTLYRHRHTSLIVPRLSLQANVPCCRLPHRNRQDQQLFSSIPASRVSFPSQASHNTQHTPSHSREPS